MFVQDKRYVFLYFSLSSMPQLCIYVVYITLYFLIHFLIVRQNAVYFDVVVSKQFQI